MKINIINIRLFIFFTMVLPFIIPAFSAAQEHVEVLTLEQTIEEAMKANLSLKISREEIKAADADKKAQRTHFFPTFSATYQYNRLDEGLNIGDFATGAKDEYSFVSSVTQPIFTGFSILRQYDIAKLGLGSAKIKEKLVRQNIILEAKTAYFMLLKAQKLRKIAEQTVIQIRSQKNVAENFYQVGMSPLNDLLQAQVELANAKQELIVAKNTMENAESDFNTLLRRPINTPVALEDILDYSPFEKDLDYCFAQANKNRLEIKIADLDVEIAEKELQLAKKDYYPSINLEGNYFRQGTEWDVDGGEGIFDPSGWNILAVAKWNFFEWGRTSYGINEKTSRLSQTQHHKEEILDDIQQELKKAYLRTQEAEKAIITVEKAIEQAKENFRINQERYKEQMATSTDVLDAQTLLSKTMTNFYNALYAYKISKASLYRAMGREIVE
ncbi:MAG: TolC family protein [Thermodesulfobacteriota bacterium]|nr:TolC family protein [Thermodesulfobacteriota bacterium]